MSKPGQRGELMARMRKSLDGMLEALTLGTHAREDDAATVIEREVLPAVRHLLEYGRLETRDERAERVARVWHEDTQRPNLCEIQGQPDVPEEDAQRRSPFAHCHSVIGAEGGGHVVLRFGGAVERIYLETLDQDGSYCKVGFPWRDVRDVLPGRQIVGSAASINVSQARLLSAALEAWADEVESEDER